MLLKICGGFLKPPQNLNRKSNNNVEIRGLSMDLEELEEELKIDDLGELFVDKWAVI